MCDDVESFGLNFVDFRACVAQNHMLKFRTAVYIVGMLAIQSYGVAAGRLSSRQ